MLWASWGVLGAAGAAAAVVPVDCTVLVEGLVEVERSAAGRWAHDRVGERMGLGEAAVVVQAAWDCRSSDSEWKRWMKAPVVVEEGHPCRSAEAGLHFRQSSGLG